MLNQFIYKLNLGIFSSFTGLPLSSLIQPEVWSGVRCWWNCDCYHEGLGSLLMQLAVPCGPADAQAWMYNSILWWLAAEPSWAYSLAGSGGSSSCCTLEIHNHFWCFIHKHSSLYHGSVAPWAFFKRCVYHSPLQIEWHCFRTLENVYTDILPAGLVINSNLYLFFFTDISITMMFARSCGPSSRALYSRLAAEPGLALDPP